LWESTPASNENFIDGERKTKKELPKTATVAADLFNQFQTAKQNLGASTASLADTTLGAVIPGVVGTVAYPVARAIYGTQMSPEQAEQKATALQQSLVSSIDKPFGKALGVTELPAYKGEASRQIMDFIGQNFSKGADWISKYTGIPKGDVESYMNTLGIAVSPAVGKGISTTAKAAQKAYGELEISPAKQQMQEQFAAKTTPTADINAPAGSVGAAKVNTNPLMGQISGEETVRGTYPQYKVSKIGEDAPQPEQATRASVVNRIYQDVGKENNQIRQGVLTGNEDTLRTEHTRAAMANPTPEGQLLKRQIADEQNTLSEFAENRVKNTGADQNLLYPAERGERINDFFAGVSPKGENPSSLPSLFRQEKGKLFQEASDKVGGNTIKTNNVDSLLNDKQFSAGLKLTNTEGVAVGAKELIELAKTVGFEDEMGKFHAANTIDAWAAVRKSLNANWTKDNAKVIRKINEAIDKDIASAGGGNLLKRANDLHQMEKELFGSKGIKDVFGQIDSNGVETGKISFDKLPEKLNSMPPNQWKHIYDVADRMASGKLVSKTLDKEGNPLWILDVPPEVQRSAQLAKNEMLGSLAREIQAAGAGKSDVWLHDAVNKVLNARQDKIAYAFPLEEQQAFRDLNAAGYLMPGKHSYEGGGQQIRRVGIIEGNLGKLGATTGAGLGTAIGGPTGGAIGGYFGQKAGVAGSEALATRALSKEAKASLEQMQKNAQLGKNTLNDIKNTK
jgi:hypothetical protein